MAWRPSLVALALVLAGCSGFAAPGPAGPVTPVPVPDGPTGPAAVPGLTADGVASPDTLAHAHRRALSNRTYTLTLRQTTGSREGVTRVAVAGQRRYNASSVQLGGAYSERTFVDGPVQYDRHRRPLGVQYARGRSVPASERFGHVTARLVGSFLPAGPAVVRPHPKGYELVARRAPRGFEPTDGYAVRAVVAPSGFVHAFAVRYRPTDRNGTVRHRFRYTEVGTTSVARPAWVRDRWPDDGRETAAPSAYDSR